MKTARKAIIATLMASLFIASLLLVFPASPGHGNTATTAPTGVSAAGSSTSFYGFSFPYVYQQPSVPKSVGVQGISGPNVPVSELGPQGQVGPSGHLGPMSVSSPEGFASSNSAVTVQVYDGTLNPLSRTGASGVNVLLQNISFGTVYSATTNSQGSAGMTVPAGWYYLSISSNSGSYTGFSQELEVKGAQMSIARYLMPAASTGPLSVNNGPSGSTFNLALHAFYAIGMNAPQVTVLLYNGSSTSSQGTGWPKQVTTNYYGYANFTGLNNAYTYTYSVQGYQQTATGVVMAGSNTTGPVSPQSSGTKSVSIQITGRTFWTASVTGTAPSQGYTASISLSGPVTFTGGVVHISAPFSTSAYPLKFENTTVYLNSSTYNTWPQMTFDNSTVIVQTPSEPFAAVGSSTIQTTFTHSRVFFSALDATAAEVSQQGGIWLASTSYYSVFVAPHIASGQVRSTLTGNFANSEFFDFNMTQSTVYNPNPVGTVHLSHDRIVNATLSWNTVYIDSSILQSYSMPNIVSYMSVTNSYVNVTKWSWQPALTFGQTAFYSHDHISAVGTGADINFGNAFTNYSYSYIDFTPSSAVPPYPSLDFAGTRVSFYNDYIIDYPTPAVRWGIIQRETGSYQGFGMTIGPAYLEMNYTQLYGMDAIGFFPPHYFWYNFSHTNFSNGWSDQEWNPFEWFAKPVQPAIPTGTFNNCTFYGIHYNSTIFWRQFNLSTDNPIGFWQNLNEPSPPTTMWGRIYVNYSTVYNLGIGTTDGYSFGISEGGIYSYLNNNLFLNRADGVFTPYGTSRWYNGSYQQYPIGTSVQHAAGNMYMTNNWFLNLNNKTVATQSMVGSGGQGGYAYFQLNSGNHFYYYPNKLQPYIPVFTTPLKVPFDSNTKDWYLFPVNPSAQALMPTHANYSYEIPVGSGDQMATSPYQDQYVFNSTVAQENVFGPNSGDLAYAWVVEPDVNTTTGRPVISFQNGMVGGPMPNFTWNGTSYQLAVEPNMTYIAAQSQSSSPIGLQFQVPVGFGTLNVWMYNSATGKEQLVRSAQETGNLSTVTVTYDPSTMPLGAVFFTNSTAGYSVTFAEKGLAQGTAWSVTLDGLQSTSTAANITFMVNDGTYGYTVSPVQGYHGSPLAGNVSVNGNNQVVQVSWNVIGYGVTFSESGLSGQNWSVTLNGTTLKSTSATISFIEQNGTYSYTINAPSNFTVNESTGIVIVNGSSTNQQVVFVPLTGTTTNPPPTSSPPGTGTSPGKLNTWLAGLPTIELLALILAPAAALLALVSVVVTRRAREKSREKKK